ncbi:MAG: zinc ribbon domain-containing protein [Paramuribaculum sp.]|nr:zinc ribbon domain-containing protein [Paramuribaculum sp.]
MALIKCPECGNTVSDKAKTCPHCGIGISDVKQGAPNNGSGGGKKLWLILVSLILIGVGVAIWVPVYQHKRAEELARIEQMRQDSIAAVEAERLRQDSILAEKIDHYYENGLSLIAGKTVYKHYEESSVGNVTVKCSITNNSDVEWYADDYAITYMTESEWQGRDGDLYYGWLSHTAEGVNVKPGETVEKTISNSGDAAKNFKIKVKISKEDFAQRYREAFDSKR